MRSYDVGEPEKKADIVVRTLDRGNGRTTGNRKIFRNTSSISRASAAVARRIVLFSFLFVFLLSLADPSTTRHATRLRNIACTAFENS